MTAIKVSTSGILSKSDMEWTGKQTNLGYGPPEMDLRNFRKKHKSLMKTGPVNTGFYRMNLQHLK